MIALRFLVKPRASRECRIPTLGSTRVALVLTIVAISGVTFSDLYKRSKPSARDFRHPRMLSGVLEIDTGLAL